MKKLLVLTLTCSLVLAMAGCGQAEDNAAANNSNVVESTNEASVESTQESTVESTEESVAESTEENVADEVVVMSHDEYVAAELDSPVVVETYVQAKQSWWENKATIYTQAEDGAYFLYELPCSEEDYAKLTQGTKIRVSGYKAEWSGEVEIIDATYEILEGNFVPEALDVTEMLGSDELINHQNEFVSFKGMTVEASKDANGNDVAFLYNWDGSGQDGNDLYFNVSYNGQTYNFAVESYLCDNTTDVYNAVEALQIGDVIDMEGFLYWYNGANPHITSVTVVE
ncbi:MAG: hypothetical protein IJ379_07480 [Lachnospiraceae bacterium]|nr:hypothetical protein [Lachnospiraceae bacterium]